MWSGQQPLARRAFLRKSLVAAGALAFPAIVQAAQSQPASRRLNLAFVGVGGKGADGLRSLTDHNFIAFCDVDDERAAGAYKKCPKVPRFRDFRRMYDALSKQIDAVLICTPDHTHFHPVVGAMQLGKHVFVEKPVASTLWECQQLEKAAAKYGVVTQMGIQGHGFNGLRVLKEWIDGGAIGQVHTIYLWTDRPLKRDIHDLTADAPGEAIPPGLDWDLWLGPRRMRDFSRHYVPQHWRAWWDFAGSAMADIGVHMFDVLEFTFQLGFPTKVDGGEAQRRIPYATPRWSSCVYHFPARNGRGPIDVHWYSGKKGTEPNLPKAIPHWPADQKFSDTGFAMCGSHGTIFIGDMRAENRPTLFPESRALEFKSQLPPQTLPRVRGDHFHDWTNAILENRRAGADLSYGAPLSEVAFLGNLAIRTGREIVWDREACKAVGLPEADAMIHPSAARSGWEFKI